MVKLKSLTKSTNIAVGNLEDLESKYKNLKCVLSGSNLGMGAGNNIGIKLSSTDYVYILNPDVFLEKNAIDELIVKSKEISEFSILSPINSDAKYPNYGIKKSKRDIKKNHLPFQVDYIDGFSMLINKNNFKDNIYFDENFFFIS